METFLYIFEHVHNNFTNCSPANAADSFSGISSGLALIGLVGECQLSQLLPGRGVGGGRGGYKEERTCGAGLTIPLNLEQRRLDGM